MNLMIEVVVKACGYLTYSERINLARLAQRVMIAALAAQEVEGVRFEVTNASVREVE